MVKFFVFDYSMIAQQRLISRAFSRCTELFWILEILNLSDLYLRNQFFQERNQQNLGYDVRAKSCHLIAWQISVLFFQSSIMEVKVLVNLAVSVFESYFEVWRCSDQSN